MWYNSRKKLRWNILGNDILVGVPIAIGLCFWFLIGCVIYYIVKESKNDKNLSMAEKKKKYFGLKFWLITIFCFPISFVYAAIKIMKYQQQYSYKELYYKELYYNELHKKQKEEKTLENGEEIQSEKKAEEKALEKLIEILENKKDKNKSPEE